VESRVLMPCHCTLPSKLNFIDANNLMMVRVCYKHVRAPALLHQLPLMLTGITGYELRLILKYLLASNVLT